MIVLKIEQQNVSQTTRGFIATMYLISILIGFNTASAQSTWSCNTQFDQKSVLQNLQFDMLQNISTEPRVVNVFVHIVRQTNGTGGLTNAQVEGWILWTH